MNLYVIPHALNDMATKFAEFLAQGVAEMPDIDHVKWTTMPDLDEFLRRIMLRAAAQALCGPGLLEVCPSFAEDFWAYDVAFPTIFRRIPRVLAPKAYEARRKLQENMKRWHVWAMANFDWENQAAIEESWEPVYGSRLMRARVVMLRDSGMSLDGWAALDSGFIWTYPDDPTSGPIRKRDDPAIYQSKMMGKESRSRNAEDDAKATLITTGIQGHFYPFGGGIKICPGRYLAKQEVMIMVAILLRAYEPEAIFDRADMDQARTQTFDACSLVARLFREMHEPYHQDL
ncbi:unnamed protein product [Parascedosporium putredinis]|uniref:Cytochrome P450 n=1 Tax=Parascedosporium putredinis TaxID=1442378 RepID=A0A9P1HA34_9PEZI|nr:unnamed protein product [Parascedosporium putredinis]CAI8002264.1 unnamed protein product [Parascedosporium putredinis]